MIKKDLRFKSHYVSTMEFKFLSYEDYDDVVALWVRAGLKFKPKGRDSKDFILKQMEKNPQMFLGAYDNGKLVGVVLLTDDGRKGWINRLAVDPDYRRKGIAKSLIDKSEEIFRERGIHLFAALIEDWNIPSQELFHSKGYNKHNDIFYFTKRDSDEY
ncbi:MAG: GNAT family N-acetyltransferase [Euryarchaeota archaeon]|nr:GNAT family N-acetyltransferase [Euryarchaeota archaeon]MVT14543.1 GNAT family N-acetyltransferase [Euryarchaeota archaeon]MVT35417.1 GNAT family N-acetyltransferase [Euryarchaeota archaeon]